MNSPLSISTQAVYIMAYEKKIALAVCTSCERWVRFFNDETAVIPAVICKTINSDGKGTINDTNNTVMICVNNAVRESKNIRIIIGCSANGTM